MCAFVHIAGKCAIVHGPDLCYIFCVGFCVSDNDLFAFPTADLSHNYDSKLLAVFHDNAFLVRRQKSFQTDLFEDMVCLSGKDTPWKDSRYQLCFREMRKTYKGNEKPRY